MSDCLTGLYSLRFPDALRAIDPEFLDRWVLPWIQEDGSLPSVPETDLSPLARYDPDLPEETPAELCAFLDFTPAPLTREEEETLAADPHAPDRVDRIFTACLPAVLSVTMDYCPAEEDLTLLLADALKELVAALDRYTPGANGGFRGYALWHVRCRLICSLWDRHPENPDAGSGMLAAEFRLRDPGNAFVSPGTPVPRIAVSSGTTALVYRKLRKEDPQRFQGILEQLTPREIQVLEMLLEEGCLSTLWDAADRFQVTTRRIQDVLGKFRRHVRRTFASEKRRMRLREYLSS